MKYFIILFAFFALVLGEDANATPSHWEVVFDGGHETGPVDDPYCGFCCKQEDATNQRLTCYGTGEMRCETSGTGPQYLHNRLIDEAGKEVRINNIASGSYNENMLIGGVLMYGTISWTTNPTTGIVTLNSTVNP